MMRVCLATHTIFSLYNLDSGSRLFYENEDTMLYRHSNARVLTIAVLFLYSLTQMGCATPLHTQKGETLTFPANPPLVLQIDPLFRPLKPLQFPLDSLTDVDRRVFVHSDDKGAILRLVILQFERVQSGASFKFAYPAKPPAQFGAQTYRFGAYVHDDEAEAAKSPAKEAGRTRALLLAEGFKVPKVFRLARLARVADPNGTTEIIIFYMEAADAEFPTRPLPMADEDGDMPLNEADASALFKRLKSVISPVSG